MTRKTYLLLFTILPPILLAPFVWIILSKTVGPRYSVSSLGTYKGTALVRISNSGQILVTYMNQDSAKLGSIVLNGSAEALTLPTLGGSQTRGMDINNGGEIVGESGTKNGDFHTFLWSETSGIKDLGRLGGKKGTAKSVNDLGRIIGDSENGSVTPPLFTWDPTNGESDLKKTMGGKWFEVWDQNNRGDIVGKGTSYYGWIGLMYSANHGTIELPRFGYSEFGTVAMGINDKGQIVGASPTRSIFVIVETLLFDLLENVGVRLGGSALVETHAVLWEQGKVYDLNTLIEPDSGWELIEAHSINDNGQIVGWGHKEGQATPVFLLTPIHDQTQDGS